MAGDWLSTLGLDPTASGMPRLGDPTTLGPQFFTPTQADFREYRSRGFDGQRVYQAEPSKKQNSPTGTAPANANVGTCERTPDGSATVVRLEATADGWIRFPGEIPADRKVVRW